MRPVRVLVLGRAWILLGSRKKTEASLSWLTGQGKMLENAVESPASSVRFVGWRFIQSTHCLNQINHLNRNLVELHHMDLAGCNNRRSVLVNSEYNQLFAQCCETHL